MKKLDQQVVHLGQMIQEIFLRFQNSHHSISRGPHTVLSHHELFLIEVLGAAGSTRMKDAAMQLGVAVNTLTGIADQLETRGFVFRARSPSDRRVVFLGLTPDGKKIFKSASKAKYEFHRATLSSLTSQERSTLLDLFRKMASVNATNAVAASAATNTHRKSK